MVGMPVLVTAAGDAQPPGTWLCQCGNTNYPTRTTCNRKVCSLPKNMGFVREIGAGSMGGMMGGMGGMNSMADMGGMGGHMGSTGNMMTHFVLPAAPGGGPRGGQGKEAYPKKGKTADQTG